MKHLKKTLRIAICLILALSLMAVPSFADEQSDLEARNAELEGQLEEEQARVDELQASVNEIENYIEVLQEEMEHIESIISDYEDEKIEKQANIDELNAQIEELEAKISEEEEEVQHQYDLMKLRIRFLYENVGDSFIEAIFSSASFSEAIEKIQYLLEISSYDRQVMVKVQNLMDQVKADKESIQEQVSVIEDEMAEIDLLQDAQEAQEELYAETKELQAEQLEEKEYELGEAEATVDAFYAEIAENESRINELIAEYEAEQAAEEERLAAEQAAAEEEAEARRQEAVEERVEELRQEAEENGEEVDDDELYQQAEEEVPEEEVSGGGSSGSNGFIWPLSGYSNITSYFGPRYDEDVLATGAIDYHYGVDIYAPQGTPIMAVADGVVLSSYWDYGIGYTVIFYHGNGLFTEYHHMCQYAIVSVGETVYQGQVVGYTGATGQYCTGPHLHFGVSCGSDAYSMANFVNPLAYY